MFLKKIYKSFANAFRGLRSAVATERNLRIHLVVSCFVLWLSYICAISRAELLFVLAVIAVVISAELFNTAIEKACDFLVPAFDNRVGLVKDISAAAVLISALVAAAGGICIFASADRVAAVALYFSGAFNFLKLAAALALALLFIFFFGQSSKSSLLRRNG